MALGLLLVGQLFQAFMRATRSGLDLARLLLC